jgi:hypothetical protein
MSLCASCSALEISRIFKDGSNTSLFLWKHSWSFPNLKLNCQFCSLLRWIINQTDVGDVECIAIHGQPRYSQGTDRALFFELEPKDNALSRIKCPHIILPLASGISSMSLGFSNLARAADNKYFDVTLAKEWLHQCDYTHGVECSMGSRLKGSSTQFRLIDIESQCVVPAPETCKYTALSYVWGKHVYQPTLTTENRRALQNSGSLSSLDIPRTILDAMDVCRKLGLRYLWIDSLCIIQDVSDDIKEQVAHMDIVYRRAYLTIIIATGKDCNTPVPSISTPRNSIQRTADLGDMTVGTSLLRIRDEILKSTWSTRAWTLQEYALSFRSLVFTPRQVIFSCAEGVRREDMTAYFNTLIPRKDRYMLPIVLDFYLANRVQDDILKEVYAPLVTMFTKREITYSQDILKAFSGILGALRGTFPRFVWGLPHESPRQFQYAMIWFSQDEMKRRPGFPSWSWAGWERVRQETQNSEGVSFMSKEMASAIHGPTKPPASLEIAKRPRYLFWVDCTVFSQAEARNNICFRGPQQKQIRMETFIARIDMSIHATFAEYLREHDPSGEKNISIQNYLDQRHLKPPASPGSHRSESPGRPDTPSKKRWFSRKKYLSAGSIAPTTENLTGSPDATQNKRSSQYEAWSRTATQYIMVADGFYLVILMSVRLIESPNICERIGNPISMSKATWAAYNPRLVEVQLA